MANLFTPPAIDVEGDGNPHVEMQPASVRLRPAIRRCDADHGCDFVGLATGAITGIDGIIFHRVVSDFMIKAGCPDGMGTGGPGYCIADEFSPALRHDRPGLLSMANRGPNTGGSQFFITKLQRLGSTTDTQSSVRSLRALT